MERHFGSRDSRGWVIGLLVLGGAIAWWMMSHPSHQSARVAETGIVSSVVEAPQSLSIPPRLEAGQGVGAGAESAPICVEQHLDVTSSDKQQRSCVSRTQVIQNGNVRTYRVESQGGAVGSALVDAAGEQILRAEVTTGSGEAFACGASRCPGISFGPYDSQGARSIVFDKARLSRSAASVGVAKSTTDADEESITVDGRLRTIPDDQLSASSCIGQVLLVSRGASTLHFCPDSGTGFDLDDAGGTTYRFTNHDGTTLGVSVNSSGALERVELGKHECRAPSCGGVSIGPPDAEGSRQFAFGGTTLFEKGSDAVTTVLNGVVVLAPQ